MLRLPGQRGGDLPLLGVLLVLVLWWYRPVLRLPYSLLPVRHHTAATVPFLNAWTIWWNADRLAHGLGGYWDAPIFFPEKGALAFSEPQPVTMLFAPWVWASGTPVVAYHVYLILALLLNGYTGALLCRELGLGRAAQWIAAFGMLFHPLAHRNFDVLQWVPVWPALWLLTCLVRFHRSPTVKQAISAAVALIVGFYVCVHHTFLVLCVLFVSSFAFIPWRKISQVCRSAPIGLGIAAMGVLPVVWPMHSIARHQGFLRGEETVRAGSARPEDWCRVPLSMWLPTTIARAERGNLPIQDHGRPMLPGVMRLVMAAIAIVFARRRDAWRGAWALRLTAPAVISALLSLGAYLEIGGFSLWEVLGHVPGFRMIRSPYRFGYLTQECLIVLAAMGWEDVAARVTKLFGHRPRAKWPVLAAVAMVGVILAAEMWPARPRVVAVPDLRDPPAWVTYLRDHAVEGRAVICLPFGAGANLHDFEPAGRWMFYQSVHRRPLVNGYSGFFPESWYRLAAAIVREPFSEESVNLLTQHGVGYIVLDHTRLPEPPVIPRRVGSAILRTCLYDDKADVMVVELRGAEASAGTCP